MKIRRLLLRSLAAIFLFVLLVFVLRVIPGTHRPMFLLLLFIGIGILLLAWLALRTPPINVKDSTAGNGQHGKARWANETEKKETYLFVGKGREQTPGFVYGFEGNQWQVDASDHNTCLLAPPGAGKTRRIIIPTIRYNAAVNRNTGGHGPSLLIMDCKGELYRETAADLQQSGYRTPTLDLRNILLSSRYNLLNNVNIAIDRYKASNDRMERAMQYGKAERYAKQLANQLIDSSTEVKSDSGDYFNETARGLLIGIILMVSEYAPARARHIISVFQLILELNGQSEDMGMLMGPQKNKLDELLEFIENKRIRYYSGPATGADMRTSMNIFSSALGKLVKFIDAELEQVLCGHDDAFDSRRFAEQPTAIFLISPDENPTRHFMSSLLTRSLMDDVIELAEKEYHGKLPRPVLLLLDEFGQQPPIQNYDALSAAIRSRGGRLLIALQDFGQLEKHYNKTISRIIEGTNQTLITSFVSPAALQTAEQLSKILGQETILTGSNSRQQGKSSSTRSLVGRALMSVSDLITMPAGEFIIIKGGQHPLKIKPPGCWAYLPSLPEPARSELEYENILVTDSASIRARTGAMSYDLSPGMFD